MPLNIIGTSVKASRKKILISLFLTTTHIQGLEVFLVLVLL